MCRIHENRTNLYYASLFAMASGPEEFGAFPLTASTVGCLGGQGSVQRSDLFNLGAWSGKRFSSWDSDTARTQGKLTNILSLGNALDDYDWVSGNFPSFPMFDGTVTEQSKSILADGKSVWRIDYNTSALTKAINPYATLIDSTVDEMRAVSDTMVVGRTWAKPNSTLNPTGVYLNEDVYFVLYQVCTESGGYAWNPIDRYLYYGGEPATPTAAETYSARAAAAATAVTNFIASTVQSAVSGGRKMLMAF